MDTKLLLQSPQKAIEAHWGHINRCSTAEEILSLAERIKTTTAEIKSIKSQKQLCARAFKDANNNVNTIVLLKVQMKGISNALDKLSAQRKQQEQLLGTFFSLSENEIVKTQPSALLPSQFNTSNVKEDSGTGPSPITYVEWEDNPPEHWDAYVSTHTNASLYHRYHWRTVITQSFGHQSHYFAALNEQQAIIGIFPTTRLTSRLFGDFAISLPYFNYGGVLANSTGVAQGLIDFAAQYYQNLGVNHLEVRSTNAQLCPWPTTSDKVSMIRALPESTEQLGREVGAKIRSQIKRAKREKPEVLKGGIKLLDQFYQVFSINMRDLGTPVYSKSFFANILKQWPDAASIMVVRIKNRPVAAAMLLGQGEMLEIPWASTLKQVNPMSINMLLYWEVLSYAINSGFTFFDFGRSTKDANTYRFKKQWGAEPVQHHWYYWLNEGAQLPNLKPENPKYSLAIKIWKLLPIRIANILGPLLVKNLP